MLKNIFLTILFSSFVSITQVSFAANTNGQVSAIDDNQQSQKANSSLKQNKSVPLKQIDNKGNNEKDNKKKPLESNSDISSKNHSKNRVIKIYISQCAPHPALDKTTQGIIDGVAEAGYIKGKNLDLIVESAQGNLALANQIAYKFISNQPDIVVGVGTISAQSLSKYAKQGKTKLVFSSVTDPILAGLVKEIDKPENNTSGVSNFVALEPQIKAFLDIKPSLKKLGFLYNPGELNSISLIKKLEIICEKFNIELVTITASKSSEVSQAAMKLAQSVDAIFISNDNTALSAFRTIVKAADKISIPVFVSDIDIMEQGAKAALGPDQYEIGKQTAEIIIDIINGADINNISVKYPDNVDLHINHERKKNI